MSDTSIFESPFAILNVWPTASRTELDEALSRARLLGDPKQAASAHQQLVNLGQRISAEVRWFPGVSRDDHPSLSSALTEGRVSRKLLDQLPALARANLMLALTEKELKEDTETDSGFIFLLCRDVISAWGQVSVEDVLNQINADRTVAGLNAVSDVELIRSATTLLVEEYRRILRVALDRMSLQDRAALLVECLGEGKKPPSNLLVGLVDDYELSCSAEATAAEKVVEKIVDTIEGLLESKGSTSAFRPQVDKLIEAIYQWDSIVQPVQLARQKQLKTHKQTIDFHRRLRKIAVRLFTERGLPRLSKQLTECFAEVFQEEREVAETVDGDLSQLDKILESKKPENRKKQAHWRKAVTWESRSRSGRLRISPEGIEYGYESIRLEDINRFRLLRDRGIGIRVAGPSERMDIFFSHLKTLNAFMDRLVTGIGDDIHYQWHGALENGQTVKVGELLIEDDGLVVTQQRFFRGPERVKIPWSRVKLVGGDGGLIFQDSTNPKASLFLSYFSVDNTIIVEALVKRLRATKYQRISDLY